MCGTVGLAHSLRCMRQARDCLAPVFLSCFGRALHAMRGVAQRPKKVADTFIIPPLRVTLRAPVVALNRDGRLAKCVRGGPDPAHTPVAGWTLAVETLHTDSPSGPTPRHGYAWARACCVHHRGAATTV